MVGSGDTLETVLGSGNNVLLKISMNLDILKAPLDKEQAEVPVRLFLTDFMSCQTDHPSVDFTIKVDCESTPLKCIFPDKPQSFDSYGQFTDWLNQGYFKNDIGITYDFHVDVQQLAPSLSQHLFSLPPNGYHFVGMHVVNNSKIIPDDYSPKVSYVSQRGNVNTTTAILGCNLYLNKKTYPINDHHQAFAHPRIEKKVFKKDYTKKFYHKNWLAQSQITVKATYQEFPNNLINGWPNAPSKTYSLLRQKPGDLKEICHIACSDGFTGESVDISDGKIFLIDVEDNAENASGFESIVTDEEGKLFIIRYLYSDIPKEKTRLESLEEEAERNSIEFELRREKLKVEKEKASESAFVAVVERLAAENRVSKKAKIDGFIKELFQVLGVSESSKEADLVLKKYEGKSSKKMSFIEKECRELILLVPMNLAKLREDHAHVSKLFPNIDISGIGCGHYHINHYGKLTNLEHKNAFHEVCEYRDLVENQMARHLKLTGRPHPCWEEFRKMR
jgi:hypothetical protein